MSTSPQISNATYTISKILKQNDHPEMGRNKTYDWLLYKAKYLTHINGSYEPTPEAKAKKYYNNNNITQRGIEEITKEIIYDIRTSNLYPMLKYEEGINLEQYPQT